MNVVELMKKLVLIAITMLMVMISLVNSDKVSHSHPSRQSVSGDYQEPQVAEMEEGKVGLARKVTGHGPSELRRIGISGLPGAGEGIFLTFNL